MIELPRSSGVQLHITSLPGGRLGPEAYRVRRLAGRSWADLVAGAAARAARSPQLSVQGPFGVRRVARAAGRSAGPGVGIRGVAFRDREAFWAVDWERFPARGALADQVRFAREWSALRAYACRARGSAVRRRGDLRGAGKRRPPRASRAVPRRFVAGAPPDAFSDTGQLWGNPVYDWPALRRRRYRWWVERMRRTLSLFDLARIDHFRGFVSYWAVPAGARMASVGRWRRGPGRALFDAVLARARARWRSSPRTSA